MRQSIKAVVIGAGIGGLTAAAAMRKHGIEVEVYERAAQLREVGAGLQIGPNAVKVLQALGLEDDLRRVSAEPRTMVSLRWDDASLRYRDPLKEISQQRYGARYLTAHRADLHHLLTGLLPEDAITLGAECVSIENGESAAVARFADGRAIEADVIIGADGIHSTVRAALFGADRPRFTNQICWRAQVAIEAMPARVGPGGSVSLAQDEYVGWLGPTGHVLFYPICGGRVLNIFAGRVSEIWADESWSVPSTREEMIGAYEGWNEAMLRVFENVDHVYRWGIYDRDPLDRWTVGRITLLGDAAHPMMPTLAQGAAISIEDGYAIARALSAHRRDWERGLQTYEQLRRPRAAAVQLQARRQFENNRKIPPPPPLDRDWIFRHDATSDPLAV